ncbi:MAG: hypothetical protein RL662_113 [Bacteroidota bacterium]|jgi:tetratricopeptide (TPR) repeat protein
MSKKSKLLIAEAREYRKLGDKENTLALLHQAIEDDSTDLVAHYLLAAIYYELRSVEASHEYCDKVLNIDPLYKEALELKAIIHEKQEEYSLSEKYFLKGLEIDSGFHNARYNLINLYYYKIKDYEKTAYHCEWMLKNRDSERLAYSKQKRMKVAEIWYLQINNIYVSSLIKLKLYQKAIDAIKDQVDFCMTFVTYFPGFFHAEDEQIYKLYYLLKDNEGILEYKNKMVNEYGISNRDLEDFEKEAQNGELRAL